VAWSVTSCAKGARRSSEDRGDIIGDPVGVAFGEEAERLGVRLRNGFGKGGIDHRVPLLLVGEGVDGDRPVEGVGEPLGRARVGEPLGSGGPVGLRLVRGGRDDDLGCDRGDLAGVDHPDATIAGGGGGAVGLCDGRGQHQEVLH